MSLVIAGSSVILAVMVIVIITSFLTQSAQAETEEDFPIKDQVSRSQKLSLHEPVRSHYSPGEISSLLNDAIATANTSMNEIALTPPENRTTENTLLKFEETYADFYDAVYPLTVMGYVYPDTDIAAEGMEAEQQANLFSIQVHSRRDLYDALRNITPSSPEEVRLFNLTLREFVKNGLSLPDDQLTRVKELRENITRCENEFVINLNNDNTSLLFSPDDLTGLPPETLSTFQKTDTGSYLVTLKYPDYYAIMQNADHPETRKRMLSAFVNRQAGPNTRLLEEAISLRRETAGLLGYQTWVDYRTDGRIARNLSNVLTFLNDLQAPLKTETHKEMASLLAMKKTQDPGATAVDAWDILHLTEQIKHQKYALNTEEIRTYLPAKGVIQGMLDQYSLLLGVRFTPVSDALVWDPTVTLYQVQNTSDDSPIAYIYMDLYPRPGKYSHTMMCPLINGRTLKDGSYSVPVSIIIGNMRGSDGDTPSLLSFDDVLALFHEFGHVMHHSLTRAPYASLSGTNVEWDFVELPSQMFEEWVYAPSVLTAISGHYLDPSRKMPEPMIQNLIASRNSDVGIVHTTRFIRSIMDVESYTIPGPVNVTDLYNRWYTDMMGIPPISGSHEGSTIDHYMGGYDAGYYSYLWSKVYALNALELFQREGLNNTTTGERFRHWILEPGNSRDGMDLLQGFLGREPGIAVLYSYLNLTSPDRSQV